MISVGLVFGIRDSDVSEAMERQERTYANMEAADYVDTKQVSIARLIARAGFSKIHLCLG